MTFASGACVIGKSDGCETDGSGRGVGTFLLRLILLCASPAVHGLS